MSGEGGPLSNAGAVSTPATAADADQQGAMGASPVSDSRPEVRVGDLTYRQLVDLVDARIVRTVHRRRIT
jgi:hypothetical protein